MWLTRLKWMAIGMALTVAVVLIYNNRTVFSKLGAGKNNMLVNKINPEFAGYISAFTSGYVSSGSGIKIKFSSEFSGSTQLNTALDKAYFSFEPSLAGNAVWKDAQTMEFTPSERLKPGQVYKATFHLDQLVEVKKELKNFEFVFQVIKQSLQLELKDLKCYNNNDPFLYSLSGTIGTADFAEAGLLENTFSATLANSALKVKWLHQDNGTNHQFLIDSIKRDPKLPGDLLIKCDGKALALDYSASHHLVVPAHDVFQLLSARVINEAEQYVLLNFSNPLDPSQALEGLINIDKSTEARYIVSNNQVAVYPAGLNSGSYQLNVNEAVKDFNGKTLNSASVHQLVFNEIKPAVRFSGEGNILSSANGMAMPFETVNLRAVDVKVIRIYENNMLQFLQNNDLDGGSQLAQVGKKVAEKRINLAITNPADFGSWKKFSLDLGSLVKSEPGAVYRVILNFKKSYSTYSCLGNKNDDKFEMEELREAEDEEEISYYSYYYDDYSYYGDEEEEGGYDYDYSERDNPCKSTYYRQYNRRVSRNVICSDLGLTVKKGNDGSLFVAVNNLVNTEPMANVSLEMYDYQKQLIQSSKTNADGQAFIKLPGKAYFLVAKKETQRAYMKLDDGAALQLSMYDVGGDAIKKGTKGFIYGERGVWRPGDSLFLNFILEDKLGGIPANHPVTFELSNPQGQLYKRLVSNKSVDGFYKFATSTDKNAETGLWNAEVRIGSIKFNKGIRIETIMPNRLKIEVSAGNNELLAASEASNLKLHTNWLTGATAKGLAATVNVALSKGKTEFKKYKDYVFDDPNQNFETQNVVVFDGKVDEQGNATQALILNTAKNAPGFLKATFNTQVFEPGGAFSVDRFSLPYSPYEFYTGIKLPAGEQNSGILYTGKDHLLMVATVDYKGNAVSRPHLRFELYKLEWRWWWDQYNEELANYASDDYHRPVQSQDFASTNGAATIRLNINENDWGRYLIRVIDTDGGHSTSAIAYFDWSNWMERDGGGNNKILSEMLSFTTDKTSYKAGEEVKINIPSPQNGRALVTIENGSRVLEAYWLNTGKGSTAFKFKVSPQMAPNIYVHIALMQPHQHNNDLPIRLYGVVPVTIDDPETHLRPKISMPGILLPEKDADIVVSEENGKEMAFTLAVVDEGLLDITRFKTPDPYQTFYAKEALGVKTWDLYDKVIGASGADLERILSIGGDGSEIGKDGAKANRFKPMVKFFGPYHLAKGAKKNIRFKMPMYLGSVRTMLIAGNKGAYGFAEKTTAVKAPLMILGTLPRVLSVSEEVKLPVSVFGGEKNVGITTIRVQVNGLLQTSGATSKTISLNKNDEKLVTFDLKVKHQTGIAKVKVSASGGGHTAVYEFELDVRNPNPYQSFNQDLWVDAGKSLTQQLSPVGLAGTNSAMLEISGIPPVNLAERLNYLITYPHGCIEQTTSQAFAQLYLDKVVELSPQRKTEIEQNIKLGISEIRKFQLTSGAMSYWQGVNDISDWGTSYAGHFLLSAEKKGYTLPPGLKKDWLAYQQSSAQNFELNKNKNFNNDISQAYRLYVLALAQQPATGAMNRLREYKLLSLQARWLLAGAYAQTGQLQEAIKLVTAAATQVEHYNVDYDTYGSSERDMAIILDVLCLMNKKAEALVQMKKVSAFLSSKSWLSTQTTAFGLVSVATFIQKFGGASALQAKCFVNGSEINLSRGAAISQIPLQFTNGNKTTVKVDNLGKGLLYLRIVNRGKPALGDEKESSENLSMNVVYKNLNGGTIQPDELVQGSNFLMTVTIKNSGFAGEIKNIALTQYIPSGWEIHNARMDENESLLKNSPFTYQDIRDDKVLTYFDLNRNESKTFNLMLNASYEGLYYLPAVNVEAMYDNSVYARSKGRWTRVVKQKQNELAGK